MKAKALAFLLILFFAISALTAGVTSRASANMLIIESIPMQQAYIRSNGAIDPATLPIERSGNTYVLKNNIVNTTIEIQKDNIILDGNGNSLTLSPSSELWWETKTAPPCIHILDHSNITVKNVRLLNNFRVPDYFTGISIENSSNIVVVKNSIEKYGIGIQINSSSSCSIIGNELRDNSNTGFSIENSSYVYLGYNNISNANPYRVIADSGGNIENARFLVMARNNISRFNSYGICVRGNN